MSQTLSKFTIVTAATLLIAGCGGDPMSEVGFSLPAGDAESGRAAFLYLQCNQCHTVAGEDIAPIESAEAPYVELGGATRKVRTYGQLVTSIIDPSHDLAEGYAEELVSEGGQSNMYNYNDFMTVRQLIDIVTFLQPHYQVELPPFPMAPYH